MGENVDQKLIVIKSQIKDHDKLQSFYELLDDKFLIGFLRGVNYDVEKALEYLESYIQMRTIKYKDFTRIHRPSSSALDCGIVHSLKNKDPFGRPVVVAHIQAWNPELTPGDAIIATALFMLDEAIRTVFSSNNELVCIIDCRGFCLQQAMQMNPFRIMLGMDMIVRSVPSRPKAIHVVNEGMLLRNVLRGIKPLLTKKIRERLQLHSNCLNSLHKYIPANILPVGSLGGELEVEEAYDHSFLIRVKGNEDFYHKLSELALT